MALWTINGKLVNNSSRIWIVLAMFALFFLVCVSHATYGQLVINVRSKGGTVLTERIKSNTTQDTITLQHEKADGTQITQFIDFKNEIQIFKVLIFGELELGEAPWQSLCFVTKLVKNEFISSDAMSKLRQKNPNAIRMPEDEKAGDTLKHDLLLDLDKTSHVSPHVASVCNLARDSTFAITEDLKALATSLGKEYVQLLGSGKRTNHYGVGRCSEVPDHERTSPCTCLLDICIEWYPCGLKYCRSRDKTGKVNRYSRCGIKTCRRCRSFVFYVSRKQQCLWDTAPDRLKHTHTDRV